MLFLALMLLQSGSFLKPPPLHLLSGKTTLLDAIAGYKTSGHLSGDIKVNGIAKDDGIWRSIAGYCEQVDLHNPSMTVIESLIFAARMRLRPFSLEDYKKVAFATNIMKLLELEDYADMLVGDEAAGEGIPKHARKRLTVGVELAANPSILFCDEPTSGKETSHFTFSFYILSTSESNYPLSPTLQGWTVFLRPW